MAKSTNKVGYEHYTSECEKAVREGYNNPMTDTDVRYNEAMNMIIDQNIPFEFLKCVPWNDIVTAEMAADRPDDMYRFCQPRGTGTTGATDTSALKKEQMFENIVKTGREKLGRLPILMKYDGLLWPVFGHKRSAVFKKGKEEGYNDLPGAFVIDLSAQYEGPDLINWVRTVMSKLSGVSNKNLNDQTEEESNGDLQRKLINEFDAQCGHDPKIRGWSEDEKVKWGIEFLQNTEETMVGDSSGIKSVRSRISRAAFSSQTSTTLEFPPDDELTDIWQKGWSSEKFNLGCDDCETTYIKDATASEQSLVRSISLGWHSRTNFSEARNDTAVIMKVKNKNATNIDGVKKAKSKALTFLTKWNTNKNYKGAGMPRVIRVCMVRQLVSGDKTRYYEWLTDGTDEFVEIDPA